MFKIPLTQGEFTIVGPKDYKYLSQWKWQYHNAGYAVHKDRTNGKQRTILMHRVILERMNHKNFVRSDHRDRNRLNNLRSNLRPATYSQSQYNRGKQSNNTSGYIGVHWHTQRRKWQARIKVKEKYMSLGLYDNIKEAARAYNAAALKYHGEFAVLNKI